MGSDVVVEMRNIVKIYPDGTVALRGVDLELRRGEIHALLGENGAGKTTLMRILYGEIKPTKGEIVVFGRRVSFSSPRDALRMGIAMVYQHFSLVPTFTVFENLYLALTSLEKVSREVARDRIEKIVSEIGLEIPLDEVVENLPVGVQQRVEIVKALLLGAKILILDEPTSVLTPIEVEKLFEVLKRLRDMGITIVLITHKLREVKMVADRVTVLRRGRVVATKNVSEVSEVELARMMVGREVFLRIEKPPREPGRTILVVEDLWVQDDRGLDAVKGVSFELREGEILGVAGVQGNGQRELAEAIAGVRPVKRGRILLDGEDITFLSPAQRYAKGLAYVPDSRAVGLVMEMNVVENAIMTSLRNFVRRFTISTTQALEFATNVVKRFEIVTPSLRAKVKYLSGGNQQKLMIGRDVARNPRIFIVCEPTHGLDVSATEYVRKLLVELRNRGCAILLISSDLDEVLDLSDRIAVMYSGRIVAMGRPSDFTLEKLGMLMGGIVEG